MKTRILSLLIMLVAVLAVNSCKKEENHGPVNPSDANALQKAITIEYGALKTGSFPVATGSAATLSAYQSSAQTNPGGQLILPFNYSGNSGFRTVYAQVQGATNGYFEINMPNAGSSSSSGTILLTINIPDYVTIGNFSLLYTIVDQQGNVSTYVVTYVVLTAQLDCATASASGSEGLTFTKVSMGNKAGSAGVVYDTYSVPDRIDIYQGSTWLAGTGSNPGSLVPPQCDCDTPLPGFIGDTGTLNFYYDPSKGNDITVVVSGCLGGGTAWDWYMECPQ